MPQCVKIRRKKRQICIGDMNELITLQNRALTAPLSGVDASEEFTDSNPDVWALVDTVTGETMFDDTGIERDVTHLFMIRFVAGVSSETWVSFDGDRFDILSVEDFDGRREFLRLRTSNRGIEANEANRA